MNINRSRLGAAALLLPAVLAVGACGKSADPAPAVARSAAGSPTAPAPDATTAGPTAGATTAGSGTGAPADKASFIAAVKASTAGVKTVHVSMGLDGAGQTMTMEGDSRTDPKDPAVKMTMSASGLDLEMVLIDKKIYILGIPGQGDAKTWAVFDENSTIGKQFAGSAGQLDPTTMYADFDKAVTDVKPLGSETLEGEQLEKYELTLDTKQMAGLSAVPDAGAKLPATLVYTAWLDADNRLRRVVFDVSGVKATMKMSKYGEAVDITAPPAAQVVKGSM